MHVFSPFCEATKYSSLLSPENKPPVAWRLS